MLPVLREIFYANILAHPLTSPVDLLFLLNTLAIYLIDNYGKISNSQIKRRF